MNINKRMLRVGVVALAIAIGSQALAAPILAESFEGVETGTLATNLLTSAWSTTDNNLSAVTNWNDAYPLANEVSPLTNSVTHSNVLQLVEGGLLSFTNGVPDRFYNFPVYVDAMVRFVLSDSDPTESNITNDTKIAIFANSSSNLVIRHGVDAGGFVVTNSVTDTVIDPEAWYRLTVEMIANEASGGYVRAQVRVNSNIVTHANAVDGNLFRSALSSGDDPNTVLTAVSFQGSGFIDDVVVTRDVPTFGGTGSGFSYVIAEYTNGVLVVHHTVTAPSAWTNTYAAATSTWYTNKFDTGTADIFTLGTNNMTVTAPVPDGIQNPTNILKMLLDQPKGTNDLPAQFAGMSSNDIAWIRSFGGTPSDTIYTNANSLAFEQAMKLSPYAQETVTAQITSFTVGTSNATIVVKVLTNGVAYASASGLTVNILIDSKASMTNEWPAVAGITNAVNTFNVRGESTNTFATPIGTDFFRARILEQ